MPPFGTVVGQINATDADYKFNNVQFSIEGGPNPPVFYVIRVLDYNDNPPGLQPAILSHHHLLHAADHVTVPDIKLQRQRRDVCAELQDCNINSRFRTVGPSVLHNGFSFNSDGLMDPKTYELLIQVTDSAVAPQFSTTATVFVTVIPWTTTMATTTKTTPRNKTIIVNKTLDYWQPDVWFIVVLTITGILFLSAIALLTWALCKRSSFCAPGTKDLTQPLLPDSSVTRNEAVGEVPNPTPPSKEKKDIAPVSPLACSLTVEHKIQFPVVNICLTATLGKDAGCDGRSHCWCSLQLMEEDGSFRL
ncbi:unnamed protein product [Ranitomeya imitator]|uniref:Cadherin domain-containing protein n=1 Tax=Ranitomeya imitator TaxID=111125 RepID=A0ABN9MQX4_9NEOB|nr:unnamed protein product [Ranitomeya imitator]